MVCGDHTEVALESVGEGFVAYASAKLPEGSLYVYTALRPLKLIALQYTSLSFL